MPRAGWLLLFAVGCQSVSAEKPADTPADRFGPTPARVELTPARSTLAAGREVLLVASVFDDKGEPRRNRRVEWAVDGPGEITAVADSSWLPGRTRKTDRGAVTYTELSDRSAKRGDGASTAVKAGQTWARVRGGTDETVVTVKVADIPDPARRSATAVLEATGGSPAPKRSRETDDDPPPAVPAKTPKPRREPVDDDRPPRRDAPEATPTGRAARPAVLSLDVIAPPAVGLNQTATVVLSAANRGGTTAPGVNLLARLPAGLELVSSDPPPAVRQGPDERDLRWGLGNLAANGVADAVTLVVRPTRRGEHRIQAAVESSDGRRDDRDIPVTADEAGLGVSLEVPPSAVEGDRVPVTVVVTNTGGVPVRNAVAFLTAGPELLTDLAPKELSVGTVGPGETRRVTAKLVAGRAGRPAVRVTVTADGDLVESARGEVIVAEGAGVRGPASNPSPRDEERPARPVSRDPPPAPAPAGRPMLELTVADPPGMVTSGGTVRVRVRVRNRGTASAKNVDLTVAGEGSLSAASGVGADSRRASGDGGRVQFPTLPEVKPGTVAVFEVVLKAGDAGSGRVSAAVRAEYLSRPLREEHEARVVER